MSNDVQKKLRVSFFCFQMPSIVHIVLTNSHINIPLANPLRNRLIDIVLTLVLGDLLCPADIKSFSTGAFKNAYYTCSGEGATPILENCPQGQYYRSSVEECRELPSGKDLGILSLTAMIEFLQLIK